MEKIQPKVFDKIIEIVKTFGDKYVADGGLKRTAVVNDLRNYDEALITALVNDDYINKHYFKKIAGKDIFLIDQFEDMLQYRDYWETSYTKYENQIGLTSGGKYLLEQEDVVLDFPFKDGVLNAAMSKEDMAYDESFFNEVIEKDEIDVMLDKKILTNATKFDEHGQHRVTNFNDENLVVKGNNLLVLHTIKEKYQGKVKLVYIDPPYYFEAKKKEDTFKYNSNFKLSTWLVFMKNRLQVAKELLSDDGAIFVQISDDGVAELHRLMKDIFNEPGKNNFINKITVKTKSPSGFASVNAGVFETAEYIIGFAKDKSKWKYNPQYIESTYDSNYKYYIKNINDDISQWEIVSLNDYLPLLFGYDNKNAFVNELGKEVFEKKMGDFALENSDSVFRYTAIGDDAGQEIVNIRNVSKGHKDKIYIVERENHYNVIVQNGQEIAFYSKKIREIDGQKVPSIQLSNIWMDTPYEGIAREGGVTLKGGKKPEKLIRRIIEIASNKGDIVMDFFGGSGTTAAVAHKLERKYITIEQIDYKENSPWNRLKSVISGEDQSGISKLIKWVGGGSFVYAELFPKNMGYLIDIINSNSIVELKAVYERMLHGSDTQEKADIDFRADLNKIDWSRGIEVNRKLLIKLIEKNQLYYNLSEIDDSNVRELISDLDYNFNKSFYGEEA
ncbi:adenine-specific DNA-methyltransferase [Paenibacillus cellulosilyticus]|uniref:Adenine-specific DNA-methyltransferase n=1 Tax=Paenibacillus cellulosilyticus TaxID=375489 RepID=A0A2V2YAR1_9BACL|nr:site-specific DNA-methyltransferase [Paenibacillus cellulosilyticus]PWV88454.1 adenine-specific DNA-methyltransferase [Paenibacillus cellulosilyticus]QKS44090.1 site-specific DNA-methyltransferase [Paenibacillus cellulosilyticus]